ncbi:hypothetical protein HDV01_003794, partial [Terramyces sp. JEL0728]
NRRDLERKFEDLKQRKLALKKKQRREGLSSDEEVDLEGLLEDIADLKEKLAELKKLRKEWMKIIEIGTKKEIELEEEKYTFREVDARTLGNITGINTNEKKWDIEESILDKEVFPSDDFIAQYKKNYQVWIMNSEASRRTYIDLFLRDVVARPEFRSSLKIFCELSMTVENISGNKRQKLTGSHDYTIGHANGTFSTTPPHESHLIAVEAKSKFSEEDIYQCVNETAALYKSRKVAGKQNCNSWGIVTNGTNWKFIFIDNGGQLWITKYYILSTFEYKEAQVLNIYRIVHYLVNCCFFASPTTTPAITPQSSGIFDE